MKTIALLAPGRDPELRRVRSLSLESLQEILGGYIEPVYVPGSMILLLVNEDGIGLDLAPCALHPDPRIRFPLLGPVVALDGSGDSFRGLVGEEAAEALELLERIRI
jgi:hypothetical protein